MGRIGSIVTGMVILLGGFALGAGAVQAVSIHDETGISVPVVGVVGADPAGADRESGDAPDRARAGRSRAAAADRGR